MGSVIGKAMDDNMKKQQEFMLESQRMQMERQMEMQNYMREQMMAMQMAASRDLFHFFAAFYGVTLFGCIAGFTRTRKPAVIVPLVPLTFIAAYLGDQAYYTKVERIRVEARQILDKEPSLIEMPTGLPSIELLDVRRKAK